VNSFASNHTALGVALRPALVGDRVVGCRVRLRLRESELYDFPEIQYRSNNLFGPRIDEDVVFPHAGKEALHARRREVDEFLVTNATATRIVDLESVSSDTLKALASPSEGSHLIFLKRTDKLSDVDMSRCGEQYRYLLSQPSSILLDTDRFQVLRLDVSESHH
jgi:hypothetical protein